MRHANGFGMIKDLLKRVAPGVVMVLGTTTAAQSMAASSVTDAIDGESRGLLSSSGTEGADVATVRRVETLFRSAQNRGTWLDAEAPLFGAAGTASARSAAPIAVKVRAALDATVEDSVLSVSVENHRPLRALVGHETAETSIIDRVGSLNGVAPDIDLAQAAPQAPRGPGSIVDLAPPLVVDYWASVTRQQGGVLVFDGYAPDEATRTAFSEVPGADVNFLNLGGGAPAGYRAAMDLGLDLLARMREGRVALSGTEFSVSGVAATPDDFGAIRAALENRIPAGITLARSEVEPPPADLYAFAASKGADGRVVLTGLLPDPDIEQRLLQQAGPSAQSEIGYASGEPAGFDAAADQALQFLSWLQSGEIRFDGTGWSITGTPATTMDEDAIETEFAVERLAQSGWSLDLADPSPIQAAPPPVEPAPQPPEPATVLEPSSIEPASAATLAQCRDQLAELSSHNAILFQSGAAIIAASATAELDAFAAALALCPQNAVEVEGHTDSDGDEGQNLALSVARAEAVVSALIERGVDAERLYAVGYGASQPVADNATAEGKRQNRRIVIALRDTAD
jgi:OmpA-OmpF porin, OOP family